MTTKKQKRGGKLIEFLRDYHEFTKKWPTSEVASALGFSRQNAYMRIKRLEKNSKK